MAEKTESSSSKAKYKISGHVFSKGGAVLSGAKITCDGLETAALADGLYVFDNLPSGSYEVRVSLEGFQPESREVTVVNSDVTVLDFYLSEAVGTARIRGRVYDSESNEPLTDGGTVILILPLFNKYAHVDKSGYYEFSNLSAGTYKLSTSIPEYNDCDNIVAVGEDETKNHDFFCKARKAVEPPWG